ncbi:hypothetical protein PoMZ_06959 [Pyricularia oryzae]|uniref:Uncharacterized protein n=1 Tax=Pyricularia oryzae TaxID=318829 RepID=A0A4P7NSH9_PYROR|nr:hypothetical protein PoMZ_06959 [Pyricularia oryzae]
MAEQPINLRKTPRFYGRTFNRQVKAFMVVHPD